MTLETSFPNSTFFNRRSAFDIREKQEIRYPPRRAGERNKIESWSFGRVFIPTELSLISCFLHLVSSEWYIVPPSPFCTGRSAFDIRKSIKYQVSRSKTLKVVRSTKYKVDSEARCENQETRLYASCQEIRMFYEFSTSSFCTQRSAFDIGFDSVFRISYLVLSIPTRSCEKHCHRPALLSLPGVLYGAARGGGSFSFSRRSLHASILLQSNGDFTGQQSSYLECPHPRKATSRPGSRSSD